MPSLFPLNPLTLDTHHPMVRITSCSRISTKHLPRCPEVHIVRPSTAAPASAADALIAQALPAPARQRKCPRGCKGSVGCRLEQRNNIGAHSLSSRMSQCWWPRHLPPGQASQGRLVCSCAAIGRQAGQDCDGGGRMAGIGQLVERHQRDVLLNFAPLLITQ